MRKRIMSAALAVMMIAGTSCGKSSEDSSTVDGTHNENTSKVYEKDIFGHVLNKDKLKVVRIDGFFNNSETIANFDHDDLDYDVELVEFKVEETLVDPAITESEEFAGDLDTGSTRNVNDAFNKLARELVSGEEYDAVIASPEIMHRLEQAGYLEDLSGYINSSLDRDDILPNVLESWGSGEVPAIYTAFTMTTAYAKGSDIKDGTDWTLDRAISEYNASSSGMKLMSNCWTNQQLWNYFLHNVMLEAIDRNKGTCDFGGDFRKALEFLDSLPRFKDYENTAFLYKGEARVEEVRIEGICGNYRSILHDSGSDPVFVGYPSSDGSTAYTVPSCMYGVFKNSRKKDGAWRLISTEFAQSYQEKMGDGSRGSNLMIPVSIKAIDALLNKSKDEPGSINYDKFEDNIRYKNMPVINEAQKKQLRDLIMSVKVDTYYDEDLIRIIKNEYRGVLLGEQTVDRCIKALNSKVGIYLGEGA